MNQIDRISRKQRKKLYNEPKTKIALALSLILLILIVVNDQMDNILDLLPKGIAVGMTEEEFNSAADSLTARLDNEFGFSDKISKGKSIDGDDLNARSYTQPWPKYLPFISYSQRIERLASEFGLVSNCVESVKKERLICVLKPRRSEADLQAVVYVIPRRSVKFRDKKIGIMIANLGNLGKSAITELLEQRVAFSYYGDIESYPSGDVKRSLKKAGISSLVNIPLDNKELLSHIPRKLKVSDTEIDYTKLGDALLGLHPNVEGINLIRNGDTDLAAARAIIEKAGKKQIKYIYSNSTPDAIDSLAYSYSLTIVRDDSLTVLRSGEIDNLDVIMLNRMINLGESSKLLSILDVGDISSKKIISLSRNLGKLGIKQLPGIKLYYSVESL